jgi:hypothetical protein
VKYEGHTCEARSVGELHHMVRGLSSAGFRIVNVLNRSSLQYNRFIIVAQKNVGTQIHIGGGERMISPRQRGPVDRDPSKNP